jgi:hypothetical protein
VSTILTSKLGVIVLAAQRGLNESWEADLSALPCRINPDDPPPACLLRGHLMSAEDGRELATQFPFPATFTDMLKVELGGIREAPVLLKPVTVQSGRSER